MAAQATNSVSVGFHAVAKIVEQPERHVEISFEKSQTPVVCLRDQLLERAKSSLPQDVQKVVEQALDVHSQHAIQHILLGIRDTIQITKDQFSEEMQGLDVDVNQKSMLEVLIEKTTLVQNRAIGDQQGRLSAAGIARVLADQASSMPQHQREAVAQALASAKPQEGKEQKDDAGKKEEGKASAPSTQLAQLLGAPQFQGDELEECVIAHMKNLAEHLVQGQAPRIKLVFQVPHQIADRVGDLVAKVQTVEPKMVGMIKASMERFLKERCIPDNQGPHCDVGRALAAKQKEAASRYQNHTIEVDQNAFARYVDFAARCDLNTFIYAPATDAIFKKGFQLDFICGILEMMGAKMKQEGSQDPYCTWTGQQFNEVLSKILA